MNEENTKLNMKIVRKNDARIRKIDNTKIALNYITKDDSKNLSLAVTESNEDYVEIINSPYDRIYYVLSGTLYLEIDERKEQIGEEEAIFIEKHQEYMLRGKFKAIVVNSPAYGS